MFLRIASIAALVWLLAARALGPSDMFDQTQPKTVAYTTDILVHGGSHWILPIERGTLGSTKPPLYNWIAAPFVRLAGFNSEIAHKFPSTIAVCVCWLVIVRLGRFLDPSHDGALGWLAGLAFVANYTIFKLGYLARPDMLLTLWLVLAWVCATAVFVRDGMKPRMNADEHGLDGVSRHSMWLVIGFWLCVGLAGLTKGPPALAVLLYAALAAKFVGGSWKSINRLQWWWGLPLALIMSAAWLLAVWKINPEHVRGVLLGDEILGRVTGTGPEGNKEGLRGWFLTFFNLAIYFVVRFLPWSLPAIATMWMSMRRKLSHRDTEARREALGLEHSPRSRTTNSGNYSSPCLDVSVVHWLRGASIFVLVVVGMFSLSAGKRADYIAAAFAPGSLLAAWWLLNGPGTLALHRPWLAPALAGLTLAAMTFVNHWQPMSPSRNFGPASAEFVEQTEVALEKEPLPIVLYYSGETQMQAMLGLSQPDDPRAVMNNIRERRTFWLIAGRPLEPPYDYGQWLMQRRKVNAEPVVRSELLPHDRGWPQQLTLYRVSPVK